MPHLDLPHCKISRGRVLSVRPDCTGQARHRGQLLIVLSSCYVLISLRRKRRPASSYVRLTLWDIAGKLVVGVETGCPPHSCALPAASSSGDMPACNISIGRHNCSPPTALPAMRDISYPQTSPTPGLRRISVCFRPCASKLLPGLLHQLAVSNVMDPRGARPDLPDYEGFQNQILRTEDIIKQRSVVENGPHTKISRQELCTKLCFGICIDKCHGAMRAFLPSGSCMEYYPGTSVVSFVRIGIQASESQVCDIAECFESH
jgi:hypothetical protein